MKRFLLLSGTISLLTPSLTLAQTMPAAPTVPSITPTLATAQQGQQIRFNGQVETAAWSQWQTSQGNRTFISEIALTQLLGAQLLSTKNPDLQPIAWFSGQNQPVIQLPVRLVGNERYFDITDLVALANWDMKIQAGQLNLNTLSARVQNVRIGKQPWGDRVVIDLDGPVTYQFEALSQEFRLVLNAETEAPIVQKINQAWQSQPTAVKPASVRRLALGEDPLDQPPPTTVESAKFKRIQSFQLETPANRTVLKLGIPIAVRPQIFTLSNPNRLVIDVGNPDITAQDIAWSPGLQWRQQSINGFPVTWLEVDPKQSGFSIAPILPNQLGNSVQAQTVSDSLAGIAPLIQTARSSGVVAAINGGFFNRNNQLPLGAIRVNQQWRSGPILSRGVVAWNPGGDFRFDRLVSQETVINNGQRLALQGFNSAYLQAGTARYNRDWGRTYSSMSDGEIIAIVRNGQVAEQKVAAKAGTIIPINPQDELLVFRSNRTGAAKFPVGTTVQFESKLLPDVSGYQQVIGGGPLLLKNSQIVLDGPSEQFSTAFVQGRAARSAIAQTRNGNILLVAAQNTADSAGPTLSEFARMLQQMGVVNALNLDGGSSTTLVLGGQILDRAPRSSARVHNGIGVFLSPKK
jgi:hypothetical protein